MPDQKTQNPTGNNPPQNPLADEIKSANEAAWLRLRDRAKTPNDVSTMMADLSAEDFNALSSAISEAKRYGRKNVDYKGFNIPLPDKPAASLRRNFEERQADIQSQIEQANKGLSQQFFGTGIGGIGTELGKMIGIKPKKVSTKNKAQKTDDRATKAEDQGKKTEDKATNTKNEERKEDVIEEEDFESSESERGPTGTLRINAQEAKTGPTGTLRMATAAAAIPASTKGGTVRLPQNTKGGTVRIPSQTKGGTVRIPSPTKGGTLRMTQAAGLTETARIQSQGAKGGTVRMAQTGPTGTIRIPESTKGGTARIPTPTGTTGTVRMPQTAAKGGTVRMSGPTGTIRVAQVSQPAAASRPEAATQSSVQVSQERKVSVASQTQTAAEKSTASTGIESIEVDKDRKVTTSTKITPPNSAPQPPQAEISSVEFQHQGKITTQTTQTGAANPAGRQESRLAFRMPGAPPPPSAPSSKRQPKGPSAPQPISSANLLSQADQLVEQAKKFTSRMAVNSSDVMLKSQMRGLREQATALRANIANTQKADSIFAPERTALSRLDDRLGMIEGSLMGDVGMGASVELATGLGLYDRERPEIGNTLSPAAPSTAPRSMATPRPTGIGAPPVAANATAPTGRIFPGPRPPRPITGMAPQRSATNQMAAAMQLGAAQQQASMQSTEGEGYGEEQLIGDSSVPPDVRAEALGQVGGVQRGGGILPGQYAPRGYEDIYGGGSSPQHVSQPQRAPGAAFQEDDEEEISEEEMAQEGGELGSDEAERARVLAEQQAAARRASDFSGAPGMTGPKPRTGPTQTPKTTAPPLPKTAAVPSAGGAGKAAVGGSPAQIAALLAAQKAQSVLVNTLAKNENLRRQIEGIRNVQKNLQNVWRIVNASELLSAEAILPIFMWILTSNLQMINKYTFKVQFIPPASIAEDGFTFCVDCLLGSNCLMNVVMYITITTLIVLPYFVAGGVTTGIFSAIGVDPLQAMWDAIQFFAK